VLHAQRQVVFPVLAEAAAHAEHLGELEGGAEAAIGRPVDVVHHAAAHAAFDVPGRSSVREAPAPGVDGADLHVVAPAVVERGRVPIAEEDVPVGGERAFLHRLSR